MEVSEMKAKVASLLLAELKSGDKAGWYYISVANERTQQFEGAYLLYAAGETDAWCRAHNLNWIPRDCSTLTNGPISAEMMLKIPEDQRWRKLSADEARNLGK